MRVQRGAGVDAGAGLSPGTDTIAEAVGPEHAAPHGERVNDLFESPVDTSAAARPAVQVAPLLRQAGVMIVQSTAEVDLERQLLVKSPDGLLVKINQLNS